MVMTRKRIPSVYVQIRQTMDGKTKSELVTVPNARLDRVRKVVENALKRADERFLAGTAP